MYEIKTTFSLVIDLEGENVYIITLMHRIECSQKQHHRFHIGLTLPKIL